MPTEMENLATADSAKGTRQDISGQCAGSGSSSGSKDIQRPKPLRR
jgi:hypothetical protein